MQSQLRAPTCPPREKPGPLFLYLLYHEATPSTQIVPGTDEAIRSRGWRMISYVSTEGCETSQPQELSFFITWSYPSPGWLWESISIPCSEDNTKSGEIRERTPLEGTAQKGMTGISRFLETHHHAYTITKSWKKPCLLEPGIHSAWWETCRALYSAGS